MQPTPSALSGPGARVRTPDGVPPGAVWVRMPRFIGDAVMIHQALEPLRSAGIPLVAWGPPLVTELFQGSGAFAGVWADGRERGRTWATRSLLRAAGVRGVINLPRSTRALLAAWMARVPLRVGWREGGGFLFATRSQAFRSSGHQLDRYRGLLAAAFPHLPPAPPVPFRPRAEAMAEARQALRELALGEGFVVLALGAMTANKRLGTGVWIELIGRLRQEGIPHLLLGGPGEDEAQAAAIQAALPGVPDLTGKLPLSASAAVVAQAKALVGNDSALGHLAAACGIPSVLVFGPTRPSVTAPVGPGVRILRREDLPCLECGLFGCPVPGHPCMEGLSPALLWQELAALLSRP
ncbi:MAG: glycosyltransferase family 9 protein [Holophaga sp.]|nr:glycosyltransferase family 9 protein [Holophaga sp.]